MSMKCNKLSFGKINRYYLLISLGAVFYNSFIFFLDQSKLFSGGFKYPIIHTINYSLGLCLSFFFWIVYKIKNKSKNPNFDNILTTEPNSNNLNLNSSSPTKQIERKEKIFMDIISFNN